MNAPAGTPSPASWLDARIGPQRRRLRLSAIASLIYAASTILLAATLAGLMHAALLDGDPAFWLLAVAAAAVLLRAGANQLQDFAALELARAVTGRLREDLFERIASLGPSGLAERAPAGAWASRSLEQVDALHGYCARHLPARRRAVLVPLLLLAAVAWVDWLAALLLALSLPLIPLFSSLIGMGSAQVHAAQQHEQQRLAAHYLDRLRALDLLRRSLALLQARDEVAAAAERLRVLTMRVLRVAFLSSAVVEFFSAVAIGLVAIYVGFALLGHIDFGPAQALTLGSGLFVLLLAPEVFAPLRTLAASHHERAAALAAAEALAGLTSPPAASSAGSMRADDAALEPGLLLRLDDVRWHPDPERPAVLDGISLILREGETLAVTGPSGAGKSSLLAVLAGFIRPDRGRLVRAPQARDCAWVGQRTRLLHGSLRENLRLACQRPCDDGWLAAALAEAGLPLDAPALPHGLDTRIGEHERGLSGGQAQRVALARALLSGRRLWLLDEPTSALDRETAQALLDRLFALARARRLTLVVASHDPDLLARCDRQLRLDRGRLLAEALTS